MLKEPLASEPQERADGVDAHELMDDTPSHAPDESGDRSIWGPLTRFVLIRVGLGVLTLWLVSVVVFAATQALPGNAATQILGRGAHDPAAVNALKQQLGLDRPLLAQYGSWISGILHGHLGTSLVSHQPVSQLIHDQIVDSTALVALAACISIPVALLLGVASAVWRDRLTDTFTNITNLVLAAMPEFVIGIVLILVFSTSVMHVLPAVSQIDPSVPITAQMNALWLPAITLSLAIIPYISRMLRASMVAVLESEYVMMARMKGLPEWVVLWRHALPNALVPTIQAVATSLAYLAGGIVTVEYLFAFPGVGAGIVSAVNTRDLPTIQALVLVVAAVYVILNLLADVATILINPRLRTGLR